MSHDIEVARSAAKEMKALRAYDRKRVVHAIEKHLTDEPTEATKNRKCLASVCPGFEFEPPLWELRVGDFRVFYDVNEEEKIVYIRAVRRKTASERTKDIVQ